MEYKQKNASIILAISLQLYVLLIFRIVGYKHRNRLVGATIFSTFQFLTTLTQTLIILVGENEESWCMASYVSQVLLIRLDIIITISCLIVMVAYYMKHVHVCSQSQTNVKWIFVPLVFVSVVVIVIILSISDAVSHEISCTTDISIHERKRRIITKIIMFIVCSVSMIVLSFVVACNRANAFSDGHISLSLGQTSRIKLVMIVQNMSTIITCFPWFIVQYNMVQAQNMFIHELVFWLYSFKGDIINLVWLFFPSLMTFLELRTFWTYGCERTVKDTQSLNSPIRLSSANRLSPTLRDDASLHTLESETYHGVIRTNLPLPKIDTGNENTPQKCLLPRPMSSEIDPMSTLDRSIQSFQTFKYSKKQETPWSPSSNRHYITEGAETFTEKSLSDEEQTMPLLPVQRDVEEKPIRSDNKPPVPSNNSTEQIRPLLSLQQPANNASVTNDKQIVRTSPSRKIPPSAILQKPFSSNLESISPDQKGIVKIRHVPSITRTFNSTDPTRLVRKLNLVVRDQNDDLAQKSRPQTQNRHTLKTSTSITLRNPGMCIPVEQDNSTDTRSKLISQAEHQPMSDRSLIDNALTINSHLTYDSTWTISSFTSEHHYEEYWPNQVLYSSAKRYSWCPSRNSFPIPNSEWSSRNSLVSGHDYEECGPPKRLLYDVSQNCISSYSKSLQTSRTSLTSEHHYEECGPGKGHDYNGTQCYKCKSIPRGFRRSHMSRLLSEECIGTDFKSKSMPRLTNNSKSWTEERFSIPVYELNHVMVMQSQRNNHSVPDNLETMYELFDQKPTEYDTKFITMPLTACGSTMPKLEDSYLVPVPVYEEIGNDSRCLNPKLQ